MAHKRAVRIHAKGAEVIFLPLRPLRAMLCVSA